MTEGPRRYVVLNLASTAGVFAAACKEPGWVPRRPGLLVSSFHVILVGEAGPATVMAERAVCASRARSRTNRGRETRSAGLGGSVATDRLPEIAALAAWRCSNSTGGTSPSASCRRLWLNQPTYSTTASSSWERVRQTRSTISSVLKE